MPEQDLFVLSVFQRLKGKMSQLIEPVVQAEGLTPLQCFVLALLSKRQLTVGALSEQTRIGQGNASNLCKRLEQAGYLERTRSNQDERVVTLTLTPKGRETMDRIRSRFDHYSQLLSQLPESVKTDLRRGIDAADYAMDYLQKQIEGEHPQC